MRSAAYAAIGLVDGTGVAGAIDEPIDGRGVPGDSVAADATGVGVRDGLGVDVGPVDGLGDNVGPTDGTGDDVGPADGLGDVRGDDVAGALGDELADALGVAVGTRPPAVGVELGEGFCTTSAGVAATTAIV